MINNKNTEHTKRIENNGHIPALVQALKTKITKILNSEENSKRKVPYQMEKSKAQPNG